MTDAKPNDLVGKPLPFLLAWGVPIAALLSLNFLDRMLPPAASVLVAAGALAWAGAGCLLNARRCGRRHCFYSGPVLLAGSAATLLLGFGVVPPGPEGINWVMWTVLALVALTFVPELIWGKYVSRREPGS